ncbi:MAG: SAM-dependent methyltransferase [Firmicutes bacterium]|nr:SAM-dependent methyltransferase [Bacillota bacterium]
MEIIFDLCLKEKSKDPVEILEKMMSLPFCRMHGPEHHVMVGAALITAYKNSGGEVDLKTALEEIYKRGKEVPGGVCGLWGACGAGLSCGMYMSIITKATGMTVEPWKLANQMTSSALEKIGETGGPRCCKRDSYTAVREAVRFTEENLGIKMDLHEIKCTRSELNPVCIKERCPYNK